MALKPQPTLDYSLRLAFDTLVELTEGQFVAANADAATVQLEAAKALIAFNRDLCLEFMFGREVEHLFRVQEPTPDDDQE